jgi:hypothetical protein
VSSAPAKGTPPFMTHNSKGALSRSRCSISPATRSMAALTLAAE